MNSYYYIDQTTQQQLGPFPMSQLYSKNIQRETMVWCAGMGDWVQAQSVDELQFLFNAPSQGTQNAGQYQQQPQQGQYQQPNNQNRGTNNPFGNPFNGVDVRPMPKNWLIESILVTILCCFPLGAPFGIAGIVNATKVESRYYGGDYDGALEASQSAKKWCIWAVVVCVIGLVLYLGFIGVMYAVGSL